MNYVFTNYQNVRKKETNLQESILTINLHCNDYSQVSKKASITTDSVAEIDEGYITKLSKTEISIREGKTTF